MSNEAIIELIPEYLWDLDWDKIKSWDDFRNAMKMINFNLVVQPGVHPDEEMVKYFTKRQIVIPENIPDDDGIERDPDGKVVWP